MKRVPVDLSLTPLRRQIGAFEDAWDALSPAHKRVLAMRCSGRSYKEVGEALGIQPQTVKNHAAALKRAMREAIGEGESLALCWLYGYLRSLRDIDERLARKRRGVGEGEE